MKCRGCGAEMKMMPTASGKKIPLNPEPDPDGNLVIFAGKAHYASAEQQRAAREGKNVTLYSTHFSNCPKANDFRKPR